jgi:hypothetical protein
VHVVTPVNTHKRLKEQPHNGKRQDQYLMNCVDNALQRWKYMHHATACHSVTGAADQRLHCTMTAMQKQHDSKIYTPAPTAVLPKTSKQSTQKPANKSRQLV